jgi:hypothetical protein
MIAAWEDDGGALIPLKPPLVGTENQIAWAEQTSGNARSTGPVRLLITHDFGYKIAKSNRVTATESTDH